LYACEGFENWLAVSCATDEQWQSLAAVIGHPELANDSSLSTLADRRREHDRLDALIGEWAGECELSDAVAELIAAGVPAAETRDNRRSSGHPQNTYRGYCEMVDHAVVGTHPTPTLPFRFASVDHWVRMPAPILGEHNKQILGGLLGHSDEELAELEEKGIIGDWPMGIER